MNSKCCIDTSETCLWYRKILWRIRWKYRKQKVGLFRLLRCAGRVFCLC